MERVVCMGHQHRDAHEAETRIVAKVTYRGVLFSPRCDRSDRRARSMGVSRPWVLGAELIM